MWEFGYLFIYSFLVTLCLLIKTIVGSETQLQVGDREGVWTPI